MVVDCFRPRALTRCFGCLFELARDRTRRLREAAGSFARRCPQIYTDKNEAVPADNPTAKGSLLEADKLFLFFYPIPTHPFLSAGKTAFTGIDPAKLSSWIQCLRMNGR